MTAVWEWVCEHPLPTVAIVWIILLLILLVLGAMADATSRRH